MDDDASASLKLSLNATGQIIDLNERSSQYFRLGQFLQIFLHDLVSQREFIQMMAEVSQGSASPNERYAFVLTTVNSDKKLDRVYQFAAEARFLCNASKVPTISLTAIPLPRHFAPWTRRSQALSDMCNADTLQQHYVYEMSAIDKKENAVIATDYLGNIIYFDEAAERLYGWQSDEILGKSITDTLCDPSTVEYG